VERVGERPLGIFDSGVGGLSVVREIRRALPAEHLLYVADTAHCPYGDRPLEEVRARALAVGGHLQGTGAKVVVTACNTATGAALERLREVLTVPVVGLEPAVKTAAARTRNRRIGVLATAGTLHSERFARLVRAHAQGTQVVPQPCPGLVELIEEGHFDGDRLGECLARLLRPLQDAQVDTVVLGCTHYPFVREAIARVLGAEVELVDSAPAIARRVTTLLAEGRMQAAAGEGSLHVFTTGDAARMQPVVERLWGAPVAVSHLEI
jgi:glutamate racemase